MPRIKIELPQHFTFRCNIPVRITDINYGGHVGNDAVLSLIHETRMQYFHSFGYSEMNLAGAGMIMADVAIEFKAELFYGDAVIASVAVNDISKVSFDLVYKLEKQTATGPKLVALAKTGMICYDYSKKKIIAIPDEAMSKFQKANSKFQ